MPNQIQATGTPASTLLPLFNPDGIRQHDGLYCLNDLHKMAGGKIKDTPSRFIILAKTQSQIQAFERLAQIHNPKKGSDLSPVIRVINGGDMQGVYACKPLMFSYTSWLNADFHALVFTVFDRVATGELTNLASLTADITHATESLNLADRCTTVAGRVLVTIGRYKKPLIKAHLAELLSLQQPQLSFTGE